MYHRELTKRGAVNFVVAPRPLENQRSKHQKTDRLDARALLDNLESYLRVSHAQAATIVEIIDSALIGLEDDVETTIQNELDDIGETMETKLHNQTTGDSSAT
jgi:hypothetical protein